MEKERLGSFRRGGWENQHPRHSSIPPLSAPILLSPLFPSPPLVSFLPPPRLSITHSLTYTHTILSCLYGSHCHLQGWLMTQACLRSIFLAYGFFHRWQGLSQCLNPLRDSRRNVSQVPRKAVSYLRHSETQELPPKSRLHMKEADICPCDLKSCNFTPEIVNLWKLLNSFWALTVQWRLIHQIY